MEGKSGFFYFFAILFVFFRLFLDTSVYFGRAAREYVRKPCDCL